MANKNIADLSSQMLVTTNKFIDKLTKFAEASHIEFDEVARRCVESGMNEIYPMIERSNYSLNQFDVNNVVSVLKRAAFLKLDASNKECYFQIRRVKVGDKYVPTIEFGIQGAGNDRILREFGDSVIDVRSYIVYEGDEFTDGYVDGWDVILPTYKRTRKSNKPLFAVYLIKKTNGEIDVAYGVLDDVKKSLLANAKQNGASDDLIRELNKYDLYEILENEKWLNYKIKKSNGYSTPLFNPSYTSPISMYNMIERKLRNHATRKYPKNFNNTKLAEIYEETYEDEKYRDGKLVIKAEEHVESAQVEFDKNNGSQELKQRNQDQEAQKVTEEKDEVLETPANLEAGEILEAVEEVEDDFVDDDTAKPIPEEEQKPQEKDSEEPSWW